MGNKKTQQVLIEIAELIGNHNPKTGLSVTASALSQRRQLIAAECFREQLHFLSELFYRHCDVRKFRGHRLLAVDGSTLWTTTIGFDEVHDHCMNWRDKTLLESSEAASENTPDKFLNSTLYDVQNGIVLDQCMEMPDGCELEMASRHFSQVKKGDILLFDRGYPAAWLFKLLEKKEVFYCCRLPLHGKWKKDFIASGAMECERSFDMHPDAATKVRKAGERTRSGGKVKFRVIRVDLPTGEVELLATNLPKRKFPVQIFGELYNQRWLIESLYYFNKNNICIEGWTSRLGNGIAQDFFISGCQVNLMALLYNETNAALLEKWGAEARRAGKLIIHEKRKPVYADKRRKMPGIYRKKINRSLALSNLRSCLMRLVFNPVSESFEFCRRIFKELLRSPSTTRTDVDKPRGKKRSRRKADLVCKHS